ncbi:MAG: T9SS type A sorting domain-containing protein [Lewinellaceae bacterium]|nr:T9SS type A sorting domain-containing protein [Lewinellaceae bacterium]
MKKDYLSRLNINQHLTKLFTALAIVCLSAFGLQAQSDATVSVTAPSGAETDIPAQQANFGPGLTMDVSGPVLEGIDTSGAATGCGSVTADLTGAIALIDRGTCSFFEKAINAQDAGAVALIVCNTEVSGGVLQPYKGLLMGAGANDPALVTIPCVAIPYQLCAEMRVNLGAGLEVTLSPTVLPAAPGELCDGAIEVTPGITTVPDLISGYGTVFANASNAAWYSYTPSENTVATVSSCALTSADTRLYILGGTCDALTIVAENDDCDPDNGGFSSEVSFIAAAGTTYFIYWDDRWDFSGFDFELSEDASALPDINVTFSVDLKYETTSADGVQMVYAGPGAMGLGDVSILALDDTDGDGIWTGTAVITALDTIGYAFVNGDVLMGGAVESVPAECGLDGGFGFNVRPYIVGGEDASLPVVCFSSCTTCEVTDCAQPAVYIDDNIDGLAVGNANGQTEWWGAWPGSTVSGEVTTEQAQTAPQSIKVAGSIAGQDVLLKFGDKTEGHYLIRWDMYVPEGNNGYFNLQHLAPTTAAGFWGLECYFENGVGRLELYDGSDPHAFAFPSGAWFPVFLFVDINNDEARLIVDENFVAGWQFSTGASAAASVNQLNSLNFYPADATYQFYVDNVKFWEIPAAGEGLYCYTATEITPGPQNFADLECFGGGFDLRNQIATNMTGLKSAWYSYTPTEDGIITVSSCGGAADSRVWVFEGECHDLKLVGMNDDRCEQANTDPYASYREVVATAGSTYYIMWDDVWDATGSDWDLSFEAIAPAEGLFCQSATAITPGVYTVSAFGDAGVLGPNINTFTSSTTPYGGSAWYSYTPDADASVTITSCEAGSDTRVWVYTGTCDNFSTLELVASNDDGTGCGVSSLIENLEVTAGTTYYIEWDDEESAEAFDWELVLNLPGNICSGAFDIQESLGQSGTVSSGPYDNTNYTTTSADPTTGWECFGEPDGAGGAPSLERTMWFTFVGDGQTYFIEAVACGDNPIGDSDTQMAIYSGDCTGLTPVDCSEDGPNAATGYYPAGLELPTEAGVTYFMMIDGFGPDFEQVGEYCLEITLMTDVSETTLQAGVKVFPNPVNDLLNVKVDLAETAENLNIRMVNTLGQVVYSRYLGRLQNDNIEIDVANMPAGAYMIQVSDGKAQYTQSVIVQ